MGTDPRDTPAMRQYARFKKAHPGCILLFRIGDFYEMFDDDAVTASKALGLTLTQRTAGIPMAGVPYHQLENYLRRFIEQGYRVAVCEQTQDAAEAKGIVERAVSRVLTPGTLVDESLLADDAPTALAAVCFPEATATPSAALAIVELSTGAFTLIACPPDRAADELARRGVSEVLFPGDANDDPPASLAPVLAALSIAGTAQPQWHFRPGDAAEALREQFGVRTLGGFGLADEADPLISPAGAIVRYLRATAMAGSGSTRLGHLRPPRKESPGDSLVIDAATFRSLEIAGTMRSGARNGLDGTLLGVFGGRHACRTGMGKRLIREWLCRPLADRAAISRRQSAVAALVEDRRSADEVRASLAGVQDVSRIAGRVALGRATPRDLVALATSLNRSGAMEAATADTPALGAMHAAFRAAGEALAPLAQRIASMCVESPPGHLRDGGLIRDGVDAALDEVRVLRNGSHQWLAEYQARLSAEHALPSLKVGYNRVHGYFIELPRAQAARAPESFSRRQTLTGAERYITPELKQFEDKVTHATARALEREQAIFTDLCASAAAAVEPIARFAAAAAELDALLCFADKAVQRGWTRPEVVDEPVLDVRQGRHPVLDELLEGDFVPNDVTLGGRPEHAALALITGPNMAGKSTYIRQTALLVILAHTGSFIPADAGATIGLCDRVFTRVGADDALFAGQSTFMVEMTETANILHHATAKSLVVLDEIGRGTGTLDGLSLAWAITERLAQTGPRCLFATHYHELTDLAERLPGRVANYHVSVREWTDTNGVDHIAFLHRILPGRTDRSYGLHVARLAGVPEPVVTRAQQVMDWLEADHEAGRAKHTPDAGALPPTPSPGQMSLFTEFVPHPAVDALREVKLEGLTPLEAFDQLRRLREMVNRDGKPHRTDAGAHKPR